MAREPSWRQVVGGLVAVAVIGAIAVAVLVFARVGVVGGRTIRIYVALSSARGVMKGTEVWLAGQPVGLVNDVEFRSITTDTSQRLLIAMDVRADVRTVLRRNSVATLRPGGRLIGAPVVSIDAGTSSSPPIADGDTIPSRPQSDPESFTSRFATAMHGLPEIMGDLKQIDSTLKSPGSTLGTFAAGGGAREVAAFRANLGRLARRVSKGGPTGFGAYREETMAHAHHALAEFDSLRALLGGDATVVGRFRRDSTLARTVADLQREAAETRALLSQPRGTLGRLSGDSAIFIELGRVWAQLDTLRADMKRHPTRYLPF